MKRAVNIIESFSGANPLIIDKIYSEGINKSVKAHIYSTIDEDGIRYFNNLSYGQLKKITEKTCESKSIFSLCGWRLRRSLRRYIKERNSMKVSQSTISTCDNYVNRKARYRNRYYKYKLHKRCLVSVSRKDRSSAMNEIPLWRLKDFLINILIYSKSKVSYYDYFTHKGIHTHGQIKGYKKKESSRPLFHFFNEGYFQGLGVISGHKKSSAGAF
jgi:hypothetical protein